MRLIADFHTHSKYSRFNHGKNKIEEMVIAANEMGLKEVAITDHGFKHFFRTNKFNLYKAREIIDEINEWSKTKVLLGIEADIISADGTLDVDSETLSVLDILLVGYHKMIKTDFAGFFGGQKKTQEAVDIATQAYINAIERYPITIITHLNSVIKTDLYQIGKACARKGVMVEINNRHMTWTDDDINDLLASECMFVVSSDAHRREDVGKVDNALDVIKKYDIPSELIANVDFDYAEKTDRDKEASFYFELYQQRKKQRADYEELSKKNNKKRFTNKLSDEMEVALRKIANEKGLKYETPQDDIYEKFSDVYETERLIKEANEYYASGAMQEFEDSEVEEGENSVFEDAITNENTEISESQKQPEYINTSQTHGQFIGSGMSQMVEEAEQKQSQVNSNHTSLDNSQKQALERLVTNNGVGAHYVNDEINKNQNVTVEPNIPKPQSGENTSFNGLALEDFMQSMKTGGKGSQNTQEKPAAPEVVARKPKQKAAPVNGGLVSQLQQITDEKNKK